MSDWAKKVQRTLEEGEKIGHIGRVEEVDYMIDQAFCSCGWSSPGYFDGREYATRNWIDHVEPLIEAGQKELEL